VFGLGGADRVIAITAIIAKIAKIAIIEKQRQKRIRYAIAVLHFRHTREFPLHFDYLRLAIGQTDRGFP
jgi:hypothetical protein